MTKAQFFHAFHTVSLFLVAVAPIMIPAVREAIAHSAFATTELLAIYALIGKLIPKS